MSFRRRLRGDYQDIRTRQRWLLLGLFLAVTVLAPAFSNPEPRIIRVGSSAADSGAAMAATPADDAGHHGLVTASSFRDIWVNPSSPTWWQEVQYVQPPERIPAAETLIVEVNVTTSAGEPLINAPVEIVWDLPGERYRVTRRTNVLGKVTSRRFIPEHVRGKRCVVAVRVDTDAFERLAYSAFVPE